MVLEGEGFRHRKGLWFAMGRDPVHTSVSVRRNLLAMRRNEVKVSIVNIPVPSLRCWKRE